LVALPSTAAAQRHQKERDRNPGVGDCVQQKKLCYTLPTMCIDLAFDAHE